MFDLIRKTFIPNYQKVTDTIVRERYGVVFSIFSIICNTIMVFFKLLISFITNSVSIRADAFNNLSDVGSNLATLFGFKLSNKHPDQAHPYGYGKIEYISGMIVAFLILLMGFEAIKEAITKIINPADINSSLIAILVLVVSICIKLLMGFMNNKAGNSIESETLKAAGQDSFNDSIMTGATLVCLLINLIFKVNLDAYFGAVVSIFVLKSGIEIFLNVMDTILGKAPDKQLIKDIEKTVVSHKHILGVHDIMMHDYGPSKQFISLHAEFDASMDIMAAHDLIDNIEVEILNKFSIYATIHMDPIDTKDKMVKKLKPIIKKIITDINPEYNIHDFRVVKGPTHTNLVFDVLIPVDDETDENELIALIKHKVKEYDKTYNCVIQVDHPFV